MMANFNEFKLSNDLLKAIEMLNFNNPTKVQKEVIPALLEEKDIIVKSQTGSGKTAAFAIPICELVTWDEKRPQALVITPTRELAIQVKEDIFNIGRFKRIKVCAVYGKSPFYSQLKELKQKTHIVVGTPGRIIDHIERGTLDTSNIKYLVLDEADEMLNMGFYEQVEYIIGDLPKNRVTILLSATMPTDIKNLCRRYMNEPMTVEIEEDIPTGDMITQERYDVEQLDKIELLRDLMIVENPDSCMIFCNTKLMVDEVYNELKHLKFSVLKIHGGMEQDDRTKTMDDFKKGYFRYLVATDVAARGIDVEDVSLILNYDLPKDAENYVHRIGRTGRIGKMGRAITFVTKYEKKLLTVIHNFIEKEIVLKQRPEKEDVNNVKHEFEEKINSTPEIKEAKGSQLSKEIMKLHINAGKRTKMRAVDIVGTLCAIEGMTAQDIGIINVMDISTYVEVLNDKGALVLRALQTMPIKGRLRSVSKSDR